VYSVDANNTAGGATSSNVELHVKLPTYTTFGFDDFDDNSRNTALWGTTDFQTSAARFSEQGGNLTFYTIGTPAGEQFAYRPWRAGALRYDNNWTAEVDLAVDDDIILGPNTDIEFGLYVFNQDDPNDYAWLTLMHERNGTGSYNDTYGVLGAVDGNESIPGVNTSINRTQDEADIRLVWDAGNQIMSFDKDDNGTWVTVQSLTIKGGGNLDWGMTAGAKFALHLFGSSNNQAITIDDEVIFDDFEIASTPPVINTPPANVSVPPTGTATFTVVASDASRYSWAGPGGPIGNSDNATLTITNVNPLDYGTYTVYANNAMGTVNSSATLSSSPPVFTTQLTAQKVVAGTSIDLNGTATGATSYQWYRNEALVGTSAVYPITNFSDANHAGSYRVVAIGAYGNDEQDELDLREPITSIGGVGYDNFNDNSNNATLWVANDFSRDGNFTEYNGTLAFSAPNGGDVSVSRVWKANAMARDSNWTAMVDVNLPALNLTGNKVVEIGLWASHQYDDNGSMVTLERNATHSYFHAETYVPGGEDSNKSITTSTHASLRLRWDANNTILYAEFDDNASDSIPSWQQLRSWNLSAGPTDWDLNSTSSFAIDLSADSEDLTLANSDNIYFDNFSVGQFNNGLVAHYIFSGDASDVSGKGNNGTVNGATPTTDRFANSNKAFFFDGVNDWVDMTAHNLPVSGANPKTISIWIKNENPNEHSRHPVVIGTQPPPDQTIFALWHRPLSHAGNGWHLEGGNENLVSGVGYNSALWRHHVITYNGTIATYYIDGVLKASEAKTLNTQTGQLRIAKHVTKEEYFKGKIDDVRVYNRALSSEEAALLYQLEKPYLHSKSYYGERVDYHAPKRRRGGV